VLEINQEFLPSPLRINKTILKISAKENIQKESERT